MKKLNLYLTASLTIALSVAGCSRQSSPDVHPTPRVRTTAALTQFNGCDALLTRLRASYGDELKTNLLLIEQQIKNNHWYWGVPGPVEDSVGGASNASGSPARTEGTSYSGTNNQETGVDEGDFVKTDGYSIFLLDGQKLVILGVPNIGELTEQSTLDLEGWPSQMLRAGNQLAIFSYVYTWGLPTDSPLVPFLGDPVYAASDGNYYNTPALTKMTLVDVTDRLNPAVTREVYLAGWLEGSREVADTVRMVSYSYLSIPNIQTYPTLPNDFWSLGTTDPQRELELHQAVLDAIAHNDATLAATPLSAFVPLMLVRDGSNPLTAYDFTGEGCTNFSMAGDAVSHGLTSILTLGLGSSFSIEADHVVSNWSNIYASTDTLVIAEPAQDWWWFWNNDSFNEATNLHRFDISTPGVTTYTGSGRIDGWVEGSYDLSEKDGFVRVAATTGEWGRWWVPNPPPPETHVYVLAGTDSLQLVGHVDGIATGERLWSARFVGDQAFLVSFLSRDPLWTIDLSTPTAPVVAGELTVAGVSTYIHPVDAGHLLTIGYGASDDQTIAWGSTQITLFDVSDFANPAVAGSLNFAPMPQADGWSGSYSSAAWDTHAFDFWAPLGMLAVPLSSWRYYTTTCPPDWPTGTVGSCWAYDYLSSLELVKVDTTAGTVTSYGSLDQSDFYNSDPYTWWWAPQISRSIFMHDDTLGDFIYAISDRAVTVHQVTTGLPRVGSVALPGTPDYRGVIVY